METGFVAAGANRSTAFCICALVSSLANEYYFLFCGGFSSEIFSRAPYFEPEIIEQKAQQFMFQHKLRLGDGDIDQIYGKKYSRKFRVRSRLGYSLGSSINETRQELLIIRHEQFQFLALRLRL